LCSITCAGDAPVKVTKSKEGENYQNNLMVAQCATVAEENVANVATTVATNEMTDKTVANVATTVAAIETTNVQTPYVAIEIDSTLRDVDAFRVAPD
jgi:hypothetical protein